MTRTVTSRALQGGIGLALLLLLLTQFDLQGLARIAASADHLLLALGVCMLALGAVIQVVRFHVVAGSFLSGPGESARIAIGGFFFQQILPGGIGGESYRMLRLRVASDQWSTAVGLVVAEKFLGVLVLVLPALVYGFLGGVGSGALAGTRGVEDFPVRWTVIVSALVGGVAIAGALWKAGWARSWWEGLTALRFRCWQLRLLGVLVLSVAYHAMRIVGFELLARAVGESVAYADWMLILAFTLVVSFVPVGIGSLGWKEGAIVAGLSFFGVPPDKGLLVALVNRAFLIGLAALGGLALIGTAGPKRELR